MLRTVTVGTIRTAPNSTDFWITSSSLSALGSPMYSVTESDGSPMLFSLRSTRSVTASRATLSIRQR